MDACLYELQSGGGARRATPVPFPMLSTPGSDGHTVTTLHATTQAAATAGAEPQPQPQQQPQLATPAGLLGAALQQGQQASEASSISAAQQQQQQQRIQEGEASSGTPPAQRLPLPAAGRGLSPATMAFVGAAFTARDTEVAEHAAAPRAVLNTSLRDADCEAGRWAWKQWGRATVPVASLV